ncbi:hypothetical protein HKK80_00770 [Halonotius sp. F2-221B]|jgi:hypothetical protein|uniref:hypothetical protein n=1 Tax=Halonotius sp. F2-221B TaxID=2731620 RepID=UPI00398BB922
MSEDPLETVQTLLESVIEETDDAEVHYKLRSALQILEASKEEVSTLKEAVADHPELEDRLSDLGYL